MLTERTGLGSSLTGVFIFAVSTVAGLVAWVRR